MYAMYQENMPQLQLVQAILKRIVESKMEWKEAAYSKNNAILPSQRWGHRMVYTNTNQLVIFAGFGGSPLEGRYLDDVWSYSIANCTWHQHTTTGPIPESRSNYTLHYDDANNSILLFGGSAESKARSSSLSILNWDRKEWTEQSLQAESDAPLERTYHSAQYHHPFLIIFGGEGPFGEDLDDTWALDTQKKRWNRLRFKDTESIPQKRRFHSTALLNQYLYVIGGCNESYVLLNDMYRVNLQGMFQNGQFSGFTWECVFSGHQILSRWGHSSLVYDQKIYIVGGKITSNTSTDHGACYDPIKQEVTPLPFNGTIILPSRRRQASALVGNSLIIFGGFNGKYLKDFYYLTLGDEFSMEIQCAIVNSRNQLLEELDKAQGKCEGDLTIKLIRNYQIPFLLKSDRCKLQNYPFFANLINYSSQQNTVINLPIFIDVTAFRLVHNSLLSKKMLIYPKFSIQQLTSILHLYEYLACSKQMQIFGGKMCRIVNKENCIQLLRVSIDIGLQDLKRKAAEFYFLYHVDHPRKRRSSQSTIDSHHYFPPLDFEEVNLQQVYQTIKFDVEQKRIKCKGGFLSKVKSVLWVQDSQTHEMQRAGRREREVVRENISSGCLHRFMTFLAGICESSKNRQYQQRF